jgi:hypothetical protein
MAGGDVIVGVIIGSCNNCTSVGGGGDVVGVSICIGGSIGGAVFCPGEVSSGNVILGLLQIGERVMKA